MPYCHESTHHGFDASPRGKGQWRQVKISLAVYLDWRLTDQIVHGTAEKLLL